MLCFSEAPDEYARGSAGGGGDTVALLSARLERAQQRIQVNSVVSNMSCSVFLKGLHICMPKLTRERTSSSLHTKSAPLTGAC